MEVLDLANANRDSWILCDAYEEAIGQVAVVCSRIPNGIAQALELLIGLCSSKSLCFAIR